MKRVWQFVFGVEDDRRFGEVPPVTLTLVIQITVIIVGVAAGFWVDSL